MFVVAWLPRAVNHGWQIIKIFLFLFPSERFRTTKNSSTPMRLIICDKNLQVNGGLLGLLRLHLLVAFVVVLNVILVSFNNFDTRCRQEHLPNSDFSFWLSFWGVTFIFLNSILLGLLLLLFYLPYKFPFPPFFSLLLLDILFMCISSSYGVP